MYDTERDCEIHTSPTSKPRVSIEMHFLKGNGLLSFASRGGLRDLSPGDCRANFNSQMMHGSPVYHPEFAPLVPCIICTMVCTLLQPPPYLQDYHHHRRRRRRRCRLQPSLAHFRLPFPRYNTTLLFFVLPQGIPEFASYTSGSFSNFRDADLRPLVRDVVA